MEQALIIGASGGIGQALHRALASQGVSVTALSRSRDGLDLSDPASIDRVMGAVDGPFDLILIATGALASAGARPEKSLRALTAPAMAAQFAVNTIGPALVLRHAARLMPRGRRAVVAALSARVGSIEDNRAGGWYSYRASKAALNQVIRSAAIELRRSHPASICVALHPGTVATAFTADYLGRHDAVEPRQAAGNLLRVVGGLAPEDSGGFFDWQGKPVPF